MSTIGIISSRSSKFHYGPNSGSQISNFTLKHPLFLVCIYILLYMHFPKLFSPTNLNCNCEAYQAKSIALRIVASTYHVNIIFPPSIYHSWQFNNKINVQLIPLYLRLKFIMVLSINKTVFDGHFLIKKICSDCLSLCPQRSSYKIPNV